MDIYEILMRSNNIQGGSTERIAREMAMMQMQREQQENAAWERAQGNAQRKLQAAAVNDPALVRLRAALEAPVEPFEGSRPGSYAPGAARDVGTLRGAFSGGGEPLPYDESPRRPQVEMAMSGRTAAPERVGEPVMNLPTLTSKGAFAEPELWDSEIGDPVRAPPRYETKVTGKRDPKRKPLPAKPRRMEGGISTHQTRDVRAPERVSDLSPEGAEMYQKLAPSLVSRRNSEETSRRTLEAEQMRGDTRERVAQLKSATDLVRQQMRAQMEADRLRAKRLSAKSKDEALKWADQERDARLNAMNHAISVVKAYKAAMADDPNDPQYREALQAADEATRAYNEAERDFNALRSQRGMDPKGKKPAGGTQTYSLDANGQLVPG